LGPYALMMPVEQIYLLRDRFQAWAQRENQGVMDAEAQEPKFCECDPKREGKTVHQDGSVECNKCHKLRQAVGE
jgi:hypothetical protein